MIISVVGQIASGKGLFVEYLTKNFNFNSFSLSSIIHREINKKEIKKITREILQDFGNDLRKRYGSHILAEMAVKEIKKELLKGKNYVIEGIRNPSEIDYLKSLKKTIIVGIKAKRVLRFKRILSRGKQWDPKNWNDFLKVDKRDLGKGENKSGQNVYKCFDYCDYILTNNKDKEDFKIKVIKLLNKILINKNFNKS